MANALTLPRRTLGQHGSAMAEFAVVAPVLVMLVLFADFFHDAVVTKLKTQEAARFGAWEFTSLPLSDYYAGTAAAHQALFNRAQGLISTDLTTKYAGFDSSNPSAGQTNFVATHALKTDASSLVFQSLDVPLQSNSTLGKIPGIGGILGSLMSAGLDVVGPQPFGFNMKGMVSVKVTSTFTNQILPTAFMEDRFHVPMLNGALAHFDMDDTVAVVADAWTLDDGRDVVPQVDNKPATIENTGNRHPMEAEVERMKFCGVTSWIPQPLQNALQQVDSYIGALMPDPLFMGGVPISALNYQRAAGNNAYSSPLGSSPSLNGGIDLRKNGHDIDIGQITFQTIPFRVTNAYADSPAVQVFNDGNKYYLGCKVAQATVDFSDSSYNCH
jgi:hypothetical protein